MKIMKLAGLTVGIMVAAELVWLHGRYRKNLLQRRMGR